MAGFLVYDQELRQCGRGQQFLDFLCREDIAKINFEYIYYSTPNDAVIESLSDEERADEALVPADDATENCEVCVQTEPGDHRDDE